MDKKTKLILSIIGAGAILLPAVLLLFLTGKTPPEPEVSSGSRQLNTQAIKEAVEKTPPKQPEFPSPTPATPSAKPSPSSGGSGSTFEGSSSAQ